MIKSPYTKNTLLKNAQAIAKAIFLREYFFSHPKRNSNFFSPTLRCFNFFCPRTLLTRSDIASNVNRFGQSVCRHLTTQLRGESMAAGNSTYKKLAVQCSADTFVVNQTLVLRINICGKNRQLLVAAKRYRQPYDDIANIRE